MNVWRHRTASLACAAVAALAHSVATAGVLYANPDDFSGAGGSYGISGPYAVSQPFILQSGAVLSGISAGLQTLSSLPASLRWSIGTSAFGSEVGSGTALLSNSNLTTQTLTSCIAGTCVAASYRYVDAYFDVPAWRLEAGSYFLTLGQALTSWTPEKYVGWGAAPYDAAAPTGTIGLVGTALAFTAMATTFSVLGTTAPPVATPIPEPASIALAAAGLAALAWTRRRTLRSQPRDAGWLPRAAAGHPRRPRRLSHHGRTRSNGRAPSAG